MRYLIDTDWIASFLNGRDEARQLLTALTFAESAISIITYGEIYEGIYWGRDPQAAEQGFRQLLHALPVLPLNRTIMQRYARVRGDLRSQGQLIGDTDLLIGATALAHDLTLVSGNTRHFSRIPSLLLY